MVKKSNQNVKFKINKSKCIYKETCLKQRSLVPDFVFGIDRYSACIG